MIPSLPKRISPNGQELWDWAGRLSEHIHRTDSQRRLRQQLRALSSECGSCRYWMTKECPRETPHGMTGYSKGPSMGASICSKFAMSPASAVLKQTWETELLAIDTQLRKATP
jgi:hypothetical protein